MKRKSNLAASMGLLLLLGACGYAASGGAQSEAATGGDDGSTKSRNVLLADVPSSGLAYREAPPVEDPGEPRPEGSYDEFYKSYGTNPFIDTEDDRLSTFATDVDTGAYTKSRNYLERGQLPPDNFPRVEEFVNYFKYNYTPPREGAFEISMDAAPSRYGADLKNCHLIRIGMQGKVVDPADRKPAVLTFVIDVSGSMEIEERLGYVKKALTMLVKQLRRDDYVGIAVYGSRGRKVLSHTNDPEAIVDALDRLNPDGSTNAEQGIRIGYEMAAKVFREGSINRVILCSDGVFNVGSTGPDALLKMVEEQRRKGITLSCIGFGMNNYNDISMEQLGDKGDGHYAYVDTLDEAKKIFVDNLTGTLQVIARDTKVQVEFNPEVVKSWRLLGYENRDVRDEDFRNDAVDGGEVGAGHSVTALYEVKLADNATGPICTATIRYKHDEKAEFFEVKREITCADIKAWEQLPTNMRLAASVAEFAELLRKSYWAKGGSYDAVIEDLKKVIGETDDTEVFDLTNLVIKARDLSKQAEGAAAGGK